MKKKTLLTLGFVVALLCLALVVDGVLFAPKPKMIDASLVELGSGIATIVVTGPNRPRLALTVKDGALRMMSPANHAIEGEAGQRLLDALRYLSYRRRVSITQAHGLDQPSVTVALTFVDGRQLTLAIGAKEERWHRTWLSSSAAPGVGFLVESHQAEALDVDVERLRSRDPFSLSGDSLGEITFVDGDITWKLKDDPLCLVVGNGCARVDVDLASGLQQTLRSLRVSQFLPVGSLPVTRVAQLTVGRASLVVGGPCPGTPGETVTESSLGRACISTAALARAMPKVQTVADWVDRRVFTGRPQDTRRIAIRAADAELTVVLEKERWTQAGGEPTPADVSAAGLWLQELQALRAKDVLVVAPNPRTGIASIRIGSADQGAAVTLTLLRRLPGGKGLVRRDQEPVALIVGSDALRFFSTDRFRFRDRSLLSFDPFLLASIEVVAGGKRIRVNRLPSVEKWTIDTKDTVDHEALLALRDVVSELRAQQFVASAARPSHRLQPPKRTITLLVDAAPTGAAPAQKITVRLGARSQDGTCFASIAGDTHVAVLGKDSCDVLYAEFTR